MPGTDVVGGDDAVPEGDGPGVGEGEEAAVDGQPLDGGGGVGVGDGDGVGLCVGAGVEAGVGDDDALATAADTGVEATPSAAPTVARNTRGHALVRDHIQGNPIAAPARRWPAGHLLAFIEGETLRTDLRVRAGIGARVLTCSRHTLGRVERPL